MPVDRCEDFPRIADHLRRLALDASGCPPFARSGAQPPFHLVSKLCERPPVIVTANLASGEGPNVSGDARMTTALPDRLARHCDIVETGDEIRRVDNRI